MKPTIHINKPLTTNDTHHDTKELPSDALRATKNKTKEIKKKETQDKQSTIRQCLYVQQSFPPRRTTRRSSAASSRRARTI